MKQELVDEVVHCLGNHRRILYYFKDRYCFDLIALEMERQGRDAITIAELKQSRFSRYMNKPMVSQALGKLGGGVLDTQSIPLLGPVDRIPFTLTLARWGDGDRDWDQTSRNQSNLVLRLNFDAGHTRTYNHLVEPHRGVRPFEYWSHPVSNVGHKTLAWIRMDIDFDTDEVLIEEVQNDWLRKARATLQRVRVHTARNPNLRPGDICWGLNCSLAQFERYVEVVLKPYEAIWAEAAMLAAIRLVKYELGLSNIYFHTFDTGKKIKRVCGSPPKSIYTKLPKDFGFEWVEQTPELLENHKFSRRCLKAIKAPSWYYMKV